ncbi:MAG: hypothetical protein ACK4WF_03455 [Candidatus Brocadiales bacterium]
MLNQKEKEQNRLIERLCKETSQAQLLTTLPGIGHHSALLIASAREMAVVAYHMLKNNTEFKDYQ